MSEAPTPTSEAQPQEGSEQEAAKTFDADYVKKLRDEAAKYRTEAKTNSEAAKRLAAIEDSQKTEAEKTAERIAKADAEVASVPAKVADALKTHLVALHKIDSEDAELFLTAPEPDLLLKQVTRLLARSDEQTAAQKKNGNYVPREGNNPSADGGDERQVLRSLFADG